jgi:membrane fusion protein, multidrug efflux system
MMRLTRVGTTAFLCFLLMSCGASPAAQSGPPAPPPVPVAVEMAVQEPVPIQVHAVGNAEPFTSVGVKAQVSGPLLSVKFTEGTNVKAGDLLFEIDPRPFRDALRQAEAAGKQHEAELRVAEANLARSRAQLKNAQADAARFEQLSKEGISTRMQEEQVRTAAEVAAQSVRADEASIEGIRATLESNRAAVDQAKLNVSYTQIHAPISGRTGNLLLHAGNLVSANSDNPLVVINQIAPIFVSFGVPERYLDSIIRQNSKNQLVVQATTGESGETVRGKLAVIDNTIDPASGTIRLKGTFDNASGRLWPGQFVNVVLTLDIQNAVLIPAEAIQAGQQGSFTYVVKPDQTVEPRPVEVGQAVGRKVVVSSGVMPGETVVTDGQSRLYPGARIGAPAKSGTSGSN